MQLNLLTFVAEVVRVLTQDLAQISEHDDLFHEVIVLFSRLFMHTLQLHLPLLEVNQLPFIFNALSLHQVQVLYDIEVAEVGRSHCLDLVHAHITLRLKLTQ